MLVRLAVFTAVAGAAFLFDVSFKKNSDEVVQTENNSEENHHAPGNVYLIAQTNPVIAKSSVQKSSCRRIHLKSHDKFIQQHHQLRNYQVLKAETVTRTAPLITSYHYLVFHLHFYSSPDEDRLVS